MSKVDYHGGLQYPHFERISGTDDLLTINHRASANQINRELQERGTISSELLCQGGESENGRSVNRGRPL